MKTSTLRSNPSQRVRIQDIRDFENEITETVNTYLQEMDCYTAPVMAVYRQKGELTVVIDDPENLHLPKGAETYAVDTLYCPGEDDPSAPEADYDRISAIANEWLFIAH